MIEDRQHHWVRFHNVDYPKDCILLPPFSPEIQSFRKHGYILRPLLEAPFLIFNHCSFPETADLFLETGNYMRGIQQILSGKFLNYTLLLVKTGLEGDVSSSINFLYHFNAGSVMNVDRQDY